MTIRLISAKAVGDDLAANRVTARQQSLYLTASFLIWLIPAYLFIFPAPRTNDSQFFWSVSLIELTLLVLFCIGGIGFCLRQCRVDPTRHFLVDFSCLNAPISLTTLIVVWGAFYLTAGLLSLAGESWLASSRVYDIIRMFASAGAVLIVFLRIGKQMSRVSVVREAANYTVEGDARKSGARSSL
jgi:hypothetical protein